MVKWVMWPALLACAAVAGAQDLAPAASGTEDLPAAPMVVASTQNGPATPSGPRSGGQNSSPNTATAAGLPTAAERRLCELKSVMVCVKDVAEDEKGIVLSPLHAPAYNLWWIVPFGVATGVSLQYDTEAIRDLGIHPSREDKFNKLSDAAGLYAPFAAAGAGYVLGSTRQNDYLKETAVLAAEAMADAGILDEGLKYALDREYPMADNAKGGFWPHGTKKWPNNPSMPSEHAMNVWSFAHVVAGQYNGIATKALVYGVATTVSVSRVLAREHFPSDVVVGSTLGWLAGGYVLNHRSKEHGRLVDVSAVETPLGEGMEVRVNLGNRD
jgi:hypothetical protein